MQTRTSALATVYERGGAPAWNRREVGEISLNSDATFERLLAEHRPKLLGFACARVHDADEAEDLVQNLYVKLWNKRSQFDESRPFEAWAKYWLGFLLKEFFRVRGRRLDLTVLERELPRLAADAGIELDDLAGIGGESRALFDREEARLEAGLIFERFLRQLPSVPHPPHQLVVFGYVKLLGWKPGTVALDLSDWEMAGLVQRLEIDFTGALPDRKAAFQPCSLRLQRATKLPIGKTMTDPNTRALYSQEFLALILGPTILWCFYTMSEDPAKNISEWCYSVRRRHVAAYAEFFDD